MFFWEVPAAMALFGVLWTMVGTPSPPSLRKGTPNKLSTDDVSVGWGLPWQDFVFLYKILHDHDPALLSSYTSVLFVWCVVLCLICPFSSCSPMFYLTCWYLSFQLKTHIFFWPSYVFFVVRPQHPPKIQQNMAHFEVITYSAAMNSASKTGDWAMATALLRQLETGRLPSRLAWLIGYEFGWLTT